MNYQCQNSDFHFEKGNNFQTSRCTHFKQGRAIDFETIRCSFLFCKTRFKRNLTELFRLVTWVHTVLKVKVKVSQILDGSVKNISKSKKIVFIMSTYQNLKAVHQPICINQASEFFIVRIESRNISILSGAQKHLFDSHSIRLVVAVNCHSSENVVSYKR